MGYIKHHAILCTSCLKDGVQKAHDKAKEIFGDLVTEVVESVTNGYLTFIIVPDGSKEEWSTSDLFNDKRDAFIEFLESSGSLYINFCELSYGGDDSSAELLRNNTGSSI